jgi:hypothetical protein
MAQTGCPTGKTRFSNASRAWERVYRHAALDGEYMHAFHCSECGDWHIGHGANSYTQKRFKAQKYWPRKMLRRREA